MLPPSEDMLPQGTPCSQHYMRSAAPKDACADLIDAVGLAILVLVGRAQHPLNELNGCV